MRLWVRSLPLLSGLRTRRCRELWGRSQTWLGSRVAVALAKPGGYGSIGSNSTPSLGTSIYHESGPRNGKKTTKQNKKKPFELGLSEDMKECSVVLTSFKSCHIVTCLAHVSRSTKAHRTFVSASFNLNVIKTRCLKLLEQFGKGTWRA